MQHERIFGTDRFWVCLVAHPRIDDPDDWVCEVSLYPRASRLGTFNGLAVQEVRVSGHLTAAEAALDEGETRGLQLANRLSTPEGARLGHKRREQPAAPTAAIDNRFG